VDVLPSFGRQVTALVVRDGVAYLATALGLELYDAAEVEGAAELPAPLGWLPLPGASFAVAADGPLLAVALGPDGVVLVDVADPAAPIVLAHLSTGDTAQGLALADGTLTVADGAAGVAFWDVTAPESPAPGALLPSATPILGVHRQGAVVYAAAGWGGLQVIDASDPAAPTLVATLDTVGEAVRARVSGGTLYVPSRYAGVRLFDLADPLAPAPLGAYALPNNNLVAEDVVIDEGAKVPAETGAPTRR